LPEKICGPHDMIWYLGQSAVCKDHRLGGWLLWTGRHHYGVVDRHRDLYLTTHNTHNRQTSMSSAGFEPKVSAGERLQTHALDGAVTGIGFRGILKTSSKVKRGNLRTCKHFTHTKLENWMTYIYKVIHKSLRDFWPLRYSSRDGHAEVERVNRGRGTPCFCPTLQMLDMSTLGDAADVNPVIKFLPHTANPVA
jgi:hypothetical protein